MLISTLSACLILVFLTVNFVTTCIFELLHPGFSSYMQYTLTVKRRQLGFLTPFIIPNKNHLRIIGFIIWILYPFEKSFDSFQRVNNFTIFILNNYNMVLTNYQLFLLFLKTLITSYTFWIWSTITLILGIRQVIKNFSSLMLRV
jgi:hypothetical protein